MTFAPADYMFVGGDWPMEYPSIRNGVAFSPAMVPYNNLRIIKIRKSIFTVK